MRPFPSWHRVHPVVADIGGGFVATEAPALQKAIRGAMRLGEFAAGELDADLTFEQGAEGRVVVRWRNHYVGFVPETHAPALRRQLAGRGRAALVSPGVVYRDGELWRVWVGEPLPGIDLPRPAAGYDSIEPEPATIFGIPVGMWAQRAAHRGHPEQPPWVLAVGGSSWDVRDGVDLDLVMFRARIARAGDGDTVQIYLVDEPVTIHLEPGTRITLTPPGGGEPEVLYPHP